MFKDERKRDVWDEIRQQDLRAFSQWLRPELFTKAAEIAQVPLGQGPLYVVNLAWLGIASAFHMGKNFADVLALTLKLLSDMPGFADTSLGKQRKKAQRRQGARRRQRSKHDPRGGDPTSVSEEAFTKARRAMPLAFWMALLSVLVEWFEQKHRRQACWKGFRLLAMDGTSIPMPNWKRLRKYFGTTKTKGKGRTVQARMVMLQMPLVRLPYRYELAPLSEGETTLAMRLVKHVRRKDLVLIDRGFFSYALFCEIDRRGASFGIRLKKGPKLRTIRTLGPKD